jgi:hypothetical protein
MLGARRDLFWTACGLLAQKAYFETNDRANGTQKEDIQNFELLRINF